MSERLPKGTWVEIHAVVLPAGARAPQVPDDTAHVAFEMRAKGFLVAPARIGSEAEVVTTTGRRLNGTVVAENPAYAHGFGPPLPELLKVGSEVRAILRERNEAK